MQIRGNAVPETVDAIERAVALAEKSGSLVQLFDLMIGRYYVILNSGDFPGASALADRALELAVRTGNPRRLAQGHIIQTIIRHQRGDLAGADQHFAAALKLFEKHGFSQSRSASGTVMSLFGFASWNAWMLGRPDAARERMAWMTAHTTDNPFDLAVSGYSAARLRVFMKEYEEAEAVAARALEISEKYQFPMYAMGCRTLLGYARAQLGRATEGIELIGQRIFGLTNERTNITMAMALLAEAQERAGLISEALETVEQALQANPDELVYRPETLRLRGELRLKQGQPGLAETDFQEALALARSMEAKAWELRTTMSLVRLLRKQGQRDEARAMLADIYGWFTEGFDTADLKDAKTLIDELSI
jgi:tetratricopeptide (TPR) repeat protein